MTITAFTALNNTNAMLAAHKLCGELIEDMPDGVVFSSWEIMPGYVGGQYSTMDSSSGAKRGLAMLANHFGLVYCEDLKNGFVQVNAVGETQSAGGGIEVHLWAHVSLPNADQATDSDEVRN
jgi:hypothetical protein